MPQLPTTPDIPINTQVTTGVAAQETTKDTPYKRGVLQISQAAALAMMCFDWDGNACPACQKEWTLYFANIRRSLVHNGPDRNTHGQTRCCIHQGQ